MARAGEEERGYRPGLFYPGWSHQPGLRACLAELQLCQTSSGAAAPPQSSSTAELGSYSGAAEMCLAKVTTPAPETEVLIGFPFFALVFFVFVLFSLAAPILVHGARWNFFFE